LHAIQSAITWSVYSPSGQSFISSVSTSALRCASWCDVEMYALTGR